MKFPLFHRLKLNPGTAVFVTIMLLAGLFIFHVVRAEGENEEGWGLWNIGQPGETSKGQVTFGADGYSLELESTASGFGPTEDELTLVGEVVQKEEFSLEVLMSSAEGEGWQGITMREVEGEQTDGVFLGINPGGKLGFLSRPDGDWLEEDVPIGQPLWLKLKKLASQVRGFYSLDGEKWIPIGMVDLEHSEMLYSGVAVAGSGNAAEASAHFVVYQANLS